MMKESKLPNNVRKLTLYSDENQHLKIPSGASIALHGHNSPSQWEVWLRNDTMQAYVCLKGECHKLLNSSKSEKYVESIKGSYDYSYEDIATFFSSVGYSVYHDLELTIM